MAEQEYTPTTEFVRRHYAKGPTAYYEDGTVAKMPTPADVVFAGLQFDRWLAAHDAEVRADERAKCEGRIQAWKDAGNAADNVIRAVLREMGEGTEVDPVLAVRALVDERAKRPDQQRPYDEATDHEFGAWETDDLEEHAFDMLAVVAHRRSDAVLSSLALEPEARETDEDAVLAAAERVYNAERDDPRRWGTLPPWDRLANPGGVRETCIRAARAALGVTAPEAAREVSRG